MSARASFYISGNDGWLNPGLSSEHAGQADKAQRWNMEELGNWRQLNIDWRPRFTKKQVDSPDHEEIFLGGKP